MKDFVFLPYLMTFVFTFFAVNFLRRVALKVGLVDKPNARKKHKGAIPVIGGVAVFLGFIFGTLMLDISLAPYRGIFFALTMIVLLGVLDDFHELSHRARFVGQALAVLIAILWEKTALYNLGALFFHYNIHFHFLAIPFTVFAIVGIINAVNMTDGVDGLVGMLSLLQFALLALLTVFAGRWGDFSLLMIFVSAILAFLCFNFPVGINEKRKIFMGDVGSTVLGFVLAWFAVALSQGPHRAATPVTFLWILAVPLFDIASVVSWRLRNKISPFSPDRRHLHHLLQEKGLSQLSIVLVIAAISLLFGVIGVVSFLEGVPEGIMSVSFVVCCIIYVFLMNYSGVFAPRLQEEGVGDA